MELQHPPTGPTKRCPSCKVTKPTDEFPKNRASKDGLADYCKPCHNAKTRASVRRHGGARHYHLRGRYGIGAPEVAALIEAQRSLCAICLRKPAVQVDHDHKSGRVRGILCDGCNGALGAFDESEERIRRAIEYLERWN